MDASIELIEDKKLVGIHAVMSFADNKTGELWRRFMPRRKYITNPLTTDLISLQVYPADYFTGFNPHREFQKWAAVEVGEFKTVPEDMNTILLPGGLYAVFHYRGPSTDSRIFQFIFETWLPNSSYQLDDRPHFEVLGAAYKNADPASEEDIWIPVKPK